jgi:hypothetical protein
MARPKEQLFLDRFIAYNTDRYKDEQDFVDALNALTLGTVTFSNYRKITNQGPTHYLVDVNSPDLFVGTDQEYTPGDYVVNNLSQLQQPDPFTVDDLEKVKVDGIYKLTGVASDISGAVLVRKNERTAVNVRQIIKENCHYLLADSDITIDVGVTTVTIDSLTVVGKVQVVESDFARGVYIHDGTYKHDGTITYQ